MYVIREAVAAFRRAPVLMGLSAGMVGLALFVVGLFSLATYNLQVALSAMEERVEVVVYLRDDARQTEIDTLPDASGFTLRDRLTLTDALIPGADPLSMDVAARLGSTLALAPALASLRHALRRVGRYWQMFQPLPILHKSRFLFAHF